MEGRPDRNGQKAMAGGEPARLKGPTRGRVMPGDPEERGLLGCEPESENSAERGLRSWKEDWERGKEGSKLWEEKRGRMSWRWPCQ